MFNSSTVKTVAGSLLAGALLVGAQWAEAQCTIAAWTGRVGPNPPVATGPEVGGPQGASAPKRYGGRCGLEAATAGESFVTDNTPNAEAVYRARFYVNTSYSGGNPVIFRATDTDRPAAPDPDNGGGNELISITYNAGNGSFEFTASGTAGAATPAASVVAGSWYGIEIHFEPGQPFSATVYPPATTVANPAPIQVSTAAAVTGQVGSHSVGAINALNGTGNIRIDEFESSRGASPVGFLCRGDANGDGVIDTLDAGLIVAERRSLNVAASPNSVPDINANGVVDTLDAGLAVAMRRAQPRKTCP